MSFGDLALIGLAALVGPLVATGARGLVPAVVGEILAGVVIGHTGFRWLDTGDPTLSFLSQIGFAMLMFHVGMRVPLRDPGLRRALGRGGTGALLAGVAAVPAGILAAAVASGPARVYAVVLASGSAAVVLPALQELGREDASALVVMAQVTVADILATIALTFVLRPHLAARAALGSLLVAACIGALLVLDRPLRRTKWVRALRRGSRERGWALDLRLALIVLFGLTWVASRSGSSALIAGFGAGLMVASIGGPERLDAQVLGVAEGLFIPLFFVDLGAKLDLRALVNEPKLLGLAGILLALNVLIHVVAARLSGQSRAAGLLETAQLGVPAAAATIGLSAHVLTPGQATALIAAAMGTIGLSAFAATRLRRAPARA